VLTQHLPVWDHGRTSSPEIPAAVPEPFREIVGQCLQVDAGKRWTVGEILHRVEAHRADAVRRGSERVEPAGPVSSAQTDAQTKKTASAPATSGRKKASAMWSYLLGLAAVIAIAFVLIPRPKPLGPTFEVPTGPGAAAGGPQAAQSSKSRERKPSSVAPEDENTRSASHDNQNGVVQQVMPQVSPSARRTIQGTIKVRVRVDVDAAGNVAKAKLELSGPSMYFSRVAMEAAREWKFAPARGDESGPREWKLQFAFSRAKTGVSAVRAKR